MKRFFIILILFIACQNVCVTSIKAEEGQVKKTGTVQLCIDTNGVYSLQAASPADSTNIYIRQGNSRDPKTYVYTDCDTIFFVNATGEEKKDNKFYMLSGFKGQNNIGVGSKTQNGTIPEPQTSNSHNLVSSRTDYLVFVDKSLGATLSISHDSKEIIPFILRKMPGEARESIVTMGLCIALKDSTISSITQFKNGKLLSFDTISLRSTDSIINICVNRKTKGQLVITKHDTTNYKVETWTIINAEEVPTRIDDIVFPSRIKYTPKHDIRGQQDSVVIRLHGTSLTQEGVIPMTIEIPITWEKAPSVWKKTLHFIIDYIIFITILLIIGGGLALIFWYKKNYEHSKDPKDGLQGPDTITDPIPTDPKDIEIANLRAQIVNLNKEKGEINKSLVSTIAQLTSAQQSVSEKENEITQLKVSKKELNQEKDQLTKKLELASQKLEKELREAQNDKQRALAELKYKLDDEYNKEKKEFSSQINQLKKEKEELSAKANIGRDELVQQLTNQLSIIRYSILEMATQLIRIPGEDDIYSSTLQNILNDFELMESEIKSIEVNPLDIDQVRSEYQRISKRHLSNAGWINAIAILSSYSKVPTVNTEFSRRGIRLHALEKLSALIHALLGTIDISIIVPTVLLSAFDSKQYESTNEEAWIDKYCHQIAIYEYKGVVVDTIQIGYSIANKETHKPLVRYN